MQGRDGAKQAESSIVVVADHVGGDGTALGRRHFGSVRFDHQIADRQDEAGVVDDDARACSIPAQAFQGAAVGIDEGLESDDAGDDILELGLGGSETDDAHVRHDDHGERHHDGVHI